MLAANHVGAIDGPLLAVFAPRPVHALTKQEMFAGALGSFLRASGQIPLDRFRPDPGAIRTCLRVIRDGGAVGIFPEGISHSSGRLEPLRTGAARMALTAAAEGVEVHLVPVGINLEQKTTFRSRVTVAYGEPFPVGPVTRGAQENGAKSLTHEIATHIRALLIEELRDERVTMLPLMPGRDVHGSGFSDLDTDNAYFLPAVEIVSYR
mgnify:CR=1 FL=1